MLNVMVICKCGHLHFSTIGRTIPVYYVGLFCQNLLMVSVCHNSCLAVVMSFWKRPKEPDAGFFMFGFGWKHACGCIVLIFD